MNDEDVRVFIAKNIKAVRDNMITERQVRIMELAEGAKVFTFWHIADELGVSYASASAQLKNLYSAGYLTRERHYQPAGGIIYTYSVAGNLEGIFTGSCKAI